MEAPSTQRLIRHQLGNFRVHSRKGDTRELRGSLRPDSRIGCPLEAKERVGSIEGNRHTIPTTTICYWLPLDQIVRNLWIGTDPLSYITVKGSGTWFSAPGSLSFYQVPRVYPVAVGSWEQANAVRFSSSSRVTKAAIA